MSEVYDFPSPHSWFGAWKVCVSMKIEGLWTLERSFDF